ncbi:TetR/AcrR family transcriptional regulator [Pseudooceanicola onchidii]|uniref:TetR/AcrR family transcriptional regulator n=1 Tax=Pseudooceanicola onchidii TaxID=2562279 RepID=UPI0010AAEE5A|nr:TetR/AcrR family transcriptional regulator [Pseudooceanicola onchidii]
MREDRRARRAAEIEDAAYAVLEAKGYDGLTMLAVAKAAKASNETLYRWYGDKSGLFEALIRRNTEGVLAQLNECKGASAAQTLDRVGQVLLAMLLGPRAVALNRAAAADGSGVLGALLAETGRGVVGPWIAGVMQRGIAEGQLGDHDPRQMTERYFSLLIGDAQVRRVTGAITEPTADWIAARTKAAMHDFLILHGPADLDAGGAKA